MRYLFLFLILTSSLAQAQPTYVYGGVSYTNMRPACDAGRIAMYPLYPSSTMTVSAYDATKIRCFVPRLNADYLSNYWFVPITNYGTSCDEGYVEDAVLGGCSPLPVDPCESKTGDSVYATSNATFSGGLGYPANQVCIDSCSYITSSGSNSHPTKCYPDFDSSGTGFCVSAFAASGVSCSGGEPSLASDQFAELPSEGEPEAPVCVNYGVHEYCADNAQPNCGTLDGQPYCNAESDTCGVVNGVFMCIPESGSRTCSYANGSYECINKTTGEKISYDSPDHPNNGGNADGNVNNDAQAPGAVVGGGVAQSGDSAATNKAITDLQSALSDKLDGISDLLGEGESAVTNVTAPTGQGSLDADEWDVKITDAKAELKASADSVAALITSANSWIINGGGGSLSCFVEEWGRVCLDDYSSQLIGIRYVLIFMAYVLAVYIIFIKD